MKLQLTSAAFLFLAATSGHAAKCSPGIQQETLLESINTLLPLAALACDIKDPTVLANYYALRPCADADCVETLNVFVATAPDCEDDAGTNVLKNIKAITDACLAGSSKGGATAAKNNSPTSAPKADVSKTPAKSASGDTAMISVATVGLTSVAWFSMA